MNAIWAERVIRDAAIALDGEDSGSAAQIFPAKEVGRLSSGDLERSCVFGDDRRRRELMMELAVRQAEAGGKPLVIALGGGFTPLAEYIPELRLYMVGDFASVNVFSVPPKAKGYSAAISGIVAALCDLSRDERGYLMHGIEMAYSGGCSAPSMREIGDRLLQLQAEVQPKEAYKIECLKNVLWELESGTVGAMSEEGDSQLKAPAVADLSSLLTWRERALVAMVLMMRVVETEATSLVVDPADWLMQESPGKAGGFPLQDWLEGLGERGKAVCLGIASGIASTRMPAGLTSVIFSGPLWGDDLGFVERSFRLGGRGTGRFRWAGEGFALACTARSGNPFQVRGGIPSFTALEPQEVLEHMRLLGEDVKRLDRSKARKERMLEKVFPDRAALVYAWEVLRLIQGGRVAVESVVRQRNATIKAVVKTLKRYFLIVEYTDSTGSGCYRLTKAGERAVSEMEGGGEGDEGKTRGA